MREYTIVIQVPDGAPDFELADFIATCGTSASHAYRLCPDMSVDAELELILYNDWKERNFSASLIRNL